MICRVSIDRLRRWESRQEGREAEPMVGIVLHGRTTCACGTVLWKGALAGSGRAASSTAAVAPGAQGIASWHQSLTATNALAVGRPEPPRRSVGIKV